MISDGDRFYSTAAWIWIIGFTLFRFAYSGLFSLVPDETNYWQWSRHLDWGYHDQAPMIAWAIRASTAWFGHTEVGVRLPSVLALFTASAYLLLLAKRYVGASAAWGIALMSQAILEFNVGGLLATPDGLQAAAWAACSYHVARGYEQHRLSQWLLGGVWFGIGMLSKYTMVLFLPGAYLYGLSVGAHRNRLMSIKPYAGLLLGFSMFIPVVLWNIRHSWNSLRHVAYLGGANEALSIHFKYFGDFLAAQAGLLSPLMLILGFMAWFLALESPHRRGQWIYLYAFFTSFPVFAFFALLSLHTRVYGNWPAAGYLTASVLVVAFFTDRRMLPEGGRLLLWGRRLWPWALASAYLITAVVLVQVVWPVLPLSPQLDRTSSEISGWKELGVAVARMKASMPNPQRTFLFGLRYQVASELAFYVPGQPHTVSINRWKRPNVYDYWWKDEDLLAWDAVGVTFSPDSHRAQLHEVFERVDPPVRLDIHRDPVFARKKGSRTPVKTFYLYRAYGFKGGLRWRPPDASDVRAVEPREP